MREKSRFSFRSFISLSAFFLFIVLTVSGVTMYLRPEGSIARWTGWRLLGLDKKAWEGVHITLALLFAALALVHIVLNWKPLVGHLKRRIADPLLPRKELVFAALFVLAGLVFSVTQWRPISGLMEWRTSIKDGQSLLEAAPPAHDADKLPLSEIARLVGADTQEIVSILTGQGFEVRGSEDTLEKISERSGTDPERTYRLILRGLGK